MHLTILLIGLALLAIAYPFIGWFPVVCASVGALLIVLGLLGLTEIAE